MSGPDQPAGLHVLDWEPGFEDDSTSQGVVGGDEHRRDDEILARRERTEVDERGLQLEGGAQRAVVGLVDRAAAVRVHEQPARLVEGVCIGVLERCRHRQGGGATLKLRAVDAFLEGAEADALAVEPETLAQPGEWHEVVVGLHELPSASDRRLT
jgi:hypothetical protein